jgi:hypothetical protein
MVSENIRAEEPPSMSSQPTEITWSSARGSCDINRQINLKTSSHSTCVYLD